MASLLVLATLPLLLVVNLSHSQELPLDALAPQGVKFHSLNFRNVLHWTRPANSNDGLQFYVQWKIYGEKQWRNVSDCQGISRLLCDLSQETSEPMEWYYARVQAKASLFGAEAHSPWVLADRFNPKRETSVSPPTMKLKVTKEGIVIRLRPPHSPLRRQGGRWISIRKLVRLSYRIYLIHNHVEEEMFEMEGCFKQQVISELSPRTTYCLQAQTVLYLGGRSSPRTPLVCVTTI